MMMLTGMMTSASQEFTDRCRNFARTFRKLQAIGGKPLCDFGEESKALICITWQLERGRWRQRQGGVALGHAFDRCARLAGDGGYENRFDLDGHCQSRQADFDRVEFDLAMPVRCHPIQSGVFETGSPQ